MTTSTIHINNTEKGVCRSSSLTYVGPD